MRASQIARITSDFKMNVISLFMYCVPNWLCGAAQVHLINTCLFAIYILRVGNSYLHIKFIFLCTYLILAK